MQEKKKFSGNVVRAKLRTVAILSPSPEEFKGWRVTTGAFSRRDLPGVGRYWLVSLQVAAFQADDLGKSRSFSSGYVVLNFPGKVNRHEN